MSEDAGVTPGREPATPPPLPPAFPRPQRMSFTGSGAEYFRIWIVNLLLTVVTLGIFSAWAKVRRSEYFYRNTRLAGAGFDYHGTPLAILKGRVLAGLLFGAYYVAGLVSPALGLVAFAALVLVLPWLIVRSLRFRLHNSSYRGLRFHFRGETRNAYFVFLGFGVASVVTLFALAPLWHHRMKRYVHSNASYGRTRFTFDAPVSAFYRIYILCSALLAALVVVAAGVIIALIGVAGLTSGLGSEQATGIGTGAALVVIAVSYVLGSVGLWALLRARVQNLVWRHTQLGPHRFTCDLRVRQLAFITFTNLLGIVCTLGLYKPFAEVRLMRYITSAFTLVPAGSLDEFVAGERQEVSAAGAEAIDMFDIEIAF